MPQARSDVSFCSDAGLVPEDGVVVAIASPTGELDMATTDQAWAVLERAIGHARGGRLAVDMSTVTFMDCRGSAVLLEARTLRGGRLSLRGPSRSISWLLDLTGLRDAFSVIESRPAACGESA